MFLDGLTIQAAAAPRSTLVVVIVAVLAGGAILFPSLAFLFKLVLSGRLGYDDDTAAPTIRRRIVAASAPGLLVRVAVSCLFAGIGLLAGTEAGWAHALGVTSLLAFIVFAFPAALPPNLRSEADGGDPQ